MLIKIKMANFICKRCLYCVKQKCTLRLHLARINPCSVAENGQDIPPAVLLEELGDVRQRKRTFQCQYCNDGFASLASLSRHRKDCKQKKTPEYRIEKKLDTLINMLQSPTTNDVESIPTNSTELVAYGKEDVSYLSSEFLSDCVVDLKNEGIPNIIEKVHFNDEHPENKNIRMVSFKQNVAESYDGVKWKRMSACSLIQNIIMEGRKIAFSNFNDKYDDYSEEQQTLIQQNFNELSDEMHKERSRIRRQLTLKITALFRKNI